MNKKRSQDLENLINNKKELLENKEKLNKQIYSEELVKAITRYKSASFNYRNAIEEIKKMRDSIQE